MKTLLYAETLKGNKVLIAIGDASIDPLETRDAAVKHAQSLPKFGELKARIKTYNDTLEKYRADGVKLADPDGMPSHVQTDLRNRLSIIKGLQDEMIAEQKRFEEKSAIYMVPASSLLVDAEVVADIDFAETEGKRVLLRTDKDGGYMGYEMIADCSGKKYRLPNTATWLYTIEPDEDIPSGALTGYPSGAEFREINKARILTLTSEEKEKEKSESVKGSENQFALDVIASDLKDDSEAAKAEARTMHDARIKDIGLIYK